MAVICVKQQMILIGTLIYVGNDKNITEDVNNLNK